MLILITCHGWTRILKWYRALMAIEKDLLRELTPEEYKNVLVRLDGVETEVNRMKIPASFADQFYALRGHIAFVHMKLTSEGHRH